MNDLESHSKQIISRKAFEALDLLCDEAEKANSMRRNILINL